MKALHLIIIVVLIAVGIFFLFPRKEILVPEMDIVVRYEGGQPVTNGEVSRSWNHYLGSGWTASIVKTDQEGRVKLKEVSTRVPLLSKMFWSVVAPFLHYYAGFAGSVKGRDAENHYIWQRVDFNDRNCCPSEIIIGLHEKKGEADDQYFTFGKVVPND